MVLVGVYVEVGLIQIALVVVDRLDVVGEEDIWLLPFQNKCQIKRRKNLKSS